jgi:hypothetical protein
MHFMRFEHLHADHYPECRLHVFLHVMYRVPLSISKRTSLILLLLVDPLSYFAPPKTSRFYPTMPPGNPSCPSLHSHVARHAPRYLHTSEVRCLYLPMASCCSDLAWQLCQMCQPCSALGMNRHCACSDRVIAACSAHPTVVSRRGMWGGYEGCQHASRWSERARRSRGQTWLRRLQGMSREVYLSRRSPR